MTNTAETLVLNGADHHYIFSAILLVIFGVILLYNIYSIFMQKRQMQLLSKAEEMILEGHKKLVDNREELFLEDGTSLDSNFLLDEIERNDETIRNLDPEAVKKRKAKADARKKKRDAMNEKARVRSEKKKMRIEAAKARKMTPEKQLKMDAKKILVYEAAYNVFNEAIDRDIAKAYAIINNEDEATKKRNDYINSKYKNPELIKRKKAEAKAKEKERKEKAKKQEKKNTKKLVREADIDVFSDENF